jgi:hypothetical protein
MSRTSAVCLLHFDSPLGNERHQAQHYIGSAKDLNQRLTLHRKGQGSRICAALFERGIGFECVRTWKGGRQFERKLKRRKQASSFCPVCAGKKEKK